MAITTIDGMVAGMRPTRAAIKNFAQLAGAAPKRLSSWPIDGAPGAGVYDTTLNGATLSSSSTLPNGSIFHSDPVSGSAYLARLYASVSSTGATHSSSVILADRLWQNRIANANTLQSITSPTWPARDANGATSGDGVYIAVELSTTCSDRAPAATLTYTNSNGDTGRTASIIDPVTFANEIIGTTLFFGLQAGDKGVRSVQSVQFSAFIATGEVNLVAYRRIAELFTQTVNVVASSSTNFTETGLIKLHNGTVPFFIFSGRGTPDTVSLYITESHG